MKNLLIALLLVANLSATPLKTTLVNSKLPNDQIIFSVGKATDEIEISAKFDSDKEIFSAAQGNWRRVIRLITYQVTDAPEGFTPKNITFLCEDMFPVEGSRISTKRVPWPFKEGTMIFTLKQDSACKLMAFFDIISYRAADDNEHGKSSN